MLAANAGWGLRGWARRGFVSVDEESPALPWRPVPALGAVKLWGDARECGSRTLLPAQVFPACVGLSQSL